MTKYEQLSETLEQHFGNRKRIESFEVLYPRKILETGQWRLLPPMRGRAFFPGGDGVWKKNEDHKLVLPFPDDPLMFVGQDFDKEDYFGQYYEWIDRNNYHEEPTEGKESSTWRNLLSLLRDTGIQPSTCFYTNLFPGIRIATSSTGTSTAFNHPDFVQQCVKFLDIQIEIVQPSAIVLMGLWPIGAILRQWLPNRESAHYGSWAAIDDNNLGCFSIERMERELPVGLITHPSMPNQHRRANGRETEVETLRRCSRKRRS
jgi:uracil-DNA glycosylase